jgi:hypothetical protein
MKLKMKKKKCKICSKLFEPEKPLQVVCGYLCGLDYSRGIMQRTRKRTNIAEKERLKTKSDYLNELQKIFNKYIRLRDKDQPCISCGTKKDIKYDAGHYISVGSSPGLRFNEDNVHKQCSNFCNKNQHGNIVAYRFHLLDRIGLERLEELESQRSKPIHLSIEDIKKLKVVYNSLIKRLV